MEWRNSLRGRMTATVTVTFAVWLLLICAGLLGYSYHTANQRATRILDGNVERVRNELSGHEREDAEGQPLTTTADKALPLINNLIAARRKFFTANHLVLFVVDTQQHIIARSPGELPHWPPLPDDHDWRLRTITAPTYTIVLGLDWEDTRDEIVRQAQAWTAKSISKNVSPLTAARWWTACACLCETLISHRSCKKYAMKSPMLCLCLCPRVTVLR